MWLRVKDYLSVEVSSSQPLVEAVSDHGRGRTRLTDLPDEVIIQILMLMAPRDLISLEVSCRRLRSLVVHYNAYKYKLDRILRCPGVTLHCTALSAAVLQ